MEQKTKQKMSTKKKASAVVAGVLVAALALGGAYAWTDYSQNARNTFKGTVAADVLLHDDFNGENKDVYVENTGESDVFVRVKFAEYLQIGNNSVLTAYPDGEDGTSTNKKADPDDVTTWAVHQFTDDEAENKGCGLDSHKYFKWNMSGALKAYLSGVTESNSNGYGGLSEEAFNALEKDEDVILGDITTQKKESLPASPVMMLSDWLAADKKPTDPCWLLDTDGWAYWSAALQPGTATNLLLDEVVATDVAPHDNWVYHIDVQLQAANLTEMEAWFHDGKSEVADPDNSVATVTENGLKFIRYRAGDDIISADGTIMGTDGARYKRVANNVYILASDTSESPTYILAGQDGLPGNADDNMLAGRSAANKGGIAVGKIDPDAMTYQIAGASEDYVVTAGIDKKLGTYDDVITSKTGALGTYEIDNVDGVDYVGWNYLGGPITNMLVATEYVLNNVTFGSSSKYAESNVKTTIETIGTALLNSGMKNVKTVTLDMSDAQHTGEQVYVCTKADHSDGVHTTNGVCTYGPSTYYTDTALKGQDDIGTTQFFALSLKEVLDAYGDSTDAAIRQLRIVQAAPKYVAESHGEYGGGFNHNNSQTWKDGAGNFITTTNYWLRSPGYCAGRAALVSTIGNADAAPHVTNDYVGARPACYLNLSATTTTP